MLLRRRKVSALEHCLYPPDVSVPIAPALAGQAVPRGWHPAASALWWGVWPVRAPQEFSWQEGKVAFTPLFPPSPFSFF